MGEVSVELYPSATLGFVAELEDTTNVAMVAAIADNGDRQAFVVLFNRHAPLLKRYFLRGGADATTSEELVQEVMLQVWRRARSFDSKRASFETWLFTIARNKRIDRFRSERWLALDPNDPALVPAAAPEADDLVALGERRIRLCEALRTLPSEQAQVVELAYWRSMTMTAIAQECDLPVATVKSRIRLAIGRLRHILGREDTP